MIYVFSLFYFKNLSDCIFIIFSRDKKYNIGNIIGKHIVFEFQMMILNLKLYGRIWA